MTKWAGDQVKILASRLGSGWLYAIIICGQIIVNFRFKVERETHLLFIEKKNAAKKWVHRGGNGGLSDNFDMFVWQWKFVLKGWLSQLGSPNQQPGLTWHIVTYIKIAVNHPFNDGEWRWSGIYVQSSPLIVIFCIMYVFHEICSLMQMITQKLVRFLFSNIINFKITFDFQIYFHSFHWPHYK